MEPTNFIKHFPIEFVYGIIAVAGGCARYLNSYAQGKKFSFSVFVASVFVAGFSGYMLALLGTSMNLPSVFPNIMAGVGGFFGDQTMKLILERFTEKLNQNG